MCLNRNRELPSLVRRVLMGLLAITAGASGQAQQFGNQGFSNYNWGVPYGQNYNYSFSRYGQGEAPYDNMMQPVPGPGMTPAPYDGYGLSATELYQAANPNNPEAAQAMQTQRQMQAMEPRYDVRKKTPRRMQAKARQANKPLTRSQVLSADGKVLWPGKAPSDGELGKSRAAADAAIMAAYKEFKAGGKASVQKVVEAKELLYAYGHPALDKAAGQSRQAGQSLHHFLFSLEQAIDSLGGV